MTAVMGTIKTCATELYVKQPSISFWRAISHNIPVLSNSTHLKLRAAHLRFPHACPGPPKSDTPKLSKLHQHQTYVWSLPSSLADPSFSRDL